MLTANLVDKSRSFLKFKKLKLSLGLTLILVNNLSAFIGNVIDFLGEFYDDISNDIVQREGFAGDTLVKMAGDNNFKPIRHGAKRGVGRLHRFSWQGVPKKK